jgi:hypothetical protein
MNFKGFGRKRSWPGISLEGLMNYTKTSGRITVVPEEIRTQHLPYASLEHYHQTKPLCNNTKHCTETVAAAVKKEQN